MMSAATSSSRLRTILSSAWFRLTARSAVAVGVLVAVVGQVGSEPFLHGLSSLDPGVIVVALALSAVATVAAAWRWSIVAGRLGVGLGVSEAVARYYRSQFLNTVLPGGVVGDVDRAVAQGRTAGDVPQAARAVVIERTMGQLVQLALALIVLVYLGSEFQEVVFPVLCTGLAMLCLAGLAIAASSIRARRALRRELGELAAGVGSAGAFLRVVLASIIVVGCHVATLGVAVAAVGASVPPPRLVALALVILLAGSIPLNIGGWGPREGIAGWAFAAAGLGASTGVAASALFGVLVMIAVVPGLVLAAASAIRRTHAHAPRCAMIPAAAERRMGS